VLQRRAAAEWSPASGSWWKKIIALFLGNFKHQLKGLSHEIDFKNVDKNLQN
jgi:hypothetical protein